MMRAGIHTNVAGHSSSAQGFMNLGGGETLRVLLSLPASLRQLPGMTERKPGIFYVKSEAYLHFHEYAAGSFADVKLNGNEFDRFPVKTRQERELLLALVAKDRSTYGQIKI